MIPRVRPPSGSGSDLAVGRAHQPRRSVHRGTEIVAVTFVGLTGGHTHPDTQLESQRPRLAEQPLGRQPPDATASQASRYATATSSPPRANRRHES
jgi:hypothetical protein